MLPPMSVNSFPVGSMAIMLDESANIKSACSEEENKGLRFAHHVTEGTLETSNSAHVQEVVEHESFEYERNGHFGLWCSGECYTHKDRCQVMSYHGFFCPICKA